MARKNGIDALQNAFAKANNNLVLTNEGNGRINMDSDSLMPSRAGRASAGKPLSPAQHASVEKAAKASVMKRRSRSVVGGGMGAPTGKGLISGKL